MTSDACNRTNDKQDIVVNVARCEYSLPFIDDYQCPNVSTYKCSHCPHSFCLQHGLQHQEDLKNEIRCLLAETQVSYCCILKEKFFPLSKSSQSEYLFVKVYSLLDLPNLMCQIDCKVTCLCTVLALPSQTVLYNLSSRSLLIAGTLRKNPKTEH
jgi:hypothetical protein